MANSNVVMNTLFRGITIYILQYFILKDTY